MKLMIKKDFEKILSEEEYKSFDRFLAAHVANYGTKMAIIKVYNHTYDNLLTSVNTYNPESILKIARERLSHSRTKLRKRALIKAIKYLEAIKQ